LTRASLISTLRRAFVIGNLNRSPTQAECRSAITVEFLCLSDPLLYRCKACKIPLLKSFAEFGLRH
jgi:hypothetical protein